MKLNLRFYGLIRDAARTKETIIENREDVSSKELLAILSRKYGKTFDDRVHENGSDNIDPHLRIFVNERLLEQDEYDKKIRDGSTVSLILAFAGGAEG